MIHAVSRTEIDYPESDGKPMGETDLHRLWMVRIYDLLKYRYRQQQVYVGSDLLIYYVEGVLREFIVPDVFVVLDCDPSPRRVFKTWQESRVPNVVFEVTSKYTRRDDEQFKPKTYAEIGVQELFLYDPTSDYLHPPLQGFRLEASGQVRLAPDATGALPCHELGLSLRLQNQQLVIEDAATAQPLLTAAEAAESRAEALQAEVNRLREKLREHGAENP